MVSAASERWPPDVVTPPPIVPAGVELRPIPQTPPKRRTRQERMGPRIMSPADYLLLAPLTMLVIGSIPRCR